MGVVTEWMVAPKYVQILMEVLFVDVIVGFSWIMMGLHVMVCRRNNYNIIIRIAIIYIILLYIIIYMYRLYTEVKVPTRFIKPRAEGTRFDKSSRDRTEVYNALLPCYSNAFDGASIK